MGGAICKAKLCDICSTPSMKLRFLRILLCFAETTLSVCLSVPGVV